MVGLPDRLTELAATEIGVIGFQQQCEAVIEGQLVQFGLRPLALMSLGHRRQLEGAHLGLR